MAPTPVDPLSGPKLAVRGRVATMDGEFAVLQDGVVYVEAGAVVAVQDAAAPAPPGFAGSKVVLTRGTIFPGLIELHNHLAYNALKLWNVPKRYANRDQWSGTPEYRKLVSGPMQVLGKTPDLLPAVVRYVEAKCLVAGVTTSQGLELFSNRGGRRYYRGIVRNVEQTDEAALPEALTKIADVEKSDAAAFLGRLEKQKGAFLLHLSEGTNQAARDHFLALQLTPTRWAITSALSGIHCAALLPANFDVLARFGGAMVWSPLSNLLLYGDTAKVAAARSAGVRLGLGSDWAPSGSKNLLGELKVAHLYCGANEISLSHRDLVAMATRDAARILRWETALGSLEAGKRADLLVIDGAAGDPYEALIRATESSVTLVMINGVPRYGHPGVMKALGVTAGESLRVNHGARTLYLDQQTADPVVGKITVKKAKSTLAAALADLPKLAKQLEVKGAAPILSTAALSGPPVWSLALDEIEETGFDVRPRLPGKARSLTGPSRKAAKASAPLSSILVPLQLDGLTVADDASFLSTIAQQRNLPAYIKTGLQSFY
jgi:5-methylthioadenosine/S-adenosylhomocysteine deaminase